MKKQKILPIIPGASKESWLLHCPNLLTENAPDLKYQQNMNQDLCIPKLSASNLYHAGFWDKAGKINFNFDSRFNFFNSGVDRHVQKLHVYEQQILPRWLQ